MDPNRNSMHKPIEGRCYWRFSQSKSCYPVKSGAVRLFFAVPVLNSAMRPAVEGFMLDRMVAEAVNVLFQVSLV